MILRIYLLSFWSDLYDEVNVVHVGAYDVVATCMYIHVHVQVISYTVVCTIMYMLYCAHLYVHSTCTYKNLISILMESAKCYIFPDMMMNLTVCMLVTTVHVYTCNDGNHPQPCTMYGFLLRVT